MRTSTARTGGGRGDADAGARSSRAEGRTRRAARDEQGRPRRAVAGDGAHGARSWRPRPAKTVETPGKASAKTVAAWAVGGSTVACTMSHGARILFVEDERRDRRAVRRGAGARGLRRSSARAPWPRRAARFAPAHAGPRAARPHAPRRRRPRPVPRAARAARRADHHAHRARDRARSRDRPRARRRRLRGQAVQRRRGHRAHPRRAAPRAAARAARRRRSTLDDLVVDPAARRRAAARRGARAVAQGVRPARRAGPQRRRASSRARS